MDSLRAFFEMGGYAVFVWSGYGLAAIAMIGLLAANSFSRARNVRRLAARSPIMAMAARP